MRPDLGGKTYRVHYGNGQVGNTCTLPEARRELAEVRRDGWRGAFIQFWDGSDWFALPRRYYE